MNFLHDFFQVWSNGLKQLPPKEFYLSLSAALLLAVCCYMICNYYSRLWNRKYHTSVTLKVLSGMASLFTFLFVLTYISFSFLKEIAVSEIDDWANRLSDDHAWEHRIMVKAYYKIRETGIEDFTAFPPPDEQRVTVPLAKSGSIELFAHLFATEASNNFESTHPFLAKGVWAKSTIPTEAVNNDIQQYFSSSPGGTYPATNAVMLVAKIIKNDLEVQAPRVVTLSRVILIGLFVLIQTIPFGLIGRAAYKDLRVTTK